MANKLYEETHVRDIADAIREKNGTTQTLTVSQMGAAVRGIPTGVDTSDATANAADLLYGATAYANGKKLEGTYGYKKFTCEVVADLVGTNAYAILSTDPILLEHRNDEALSIIITADDAPTISYTLTKTFTFNKSGVLFGWGRGASPELQKQYRIRYANTGELDSQYSVTSLNAADKSELVGVYSVWITPEGELRLYSGSNNYVVRAGTYTVEVRW